VDCLGSGDVPVHVGEEFLVSSFDVIVVGAGHNGLTTAFYLAAAGKSVLVLEARGSVGGAAGTEEFIHGYHFSSCAHVLRYLQPRVAADMDLARRGVRVHQLDPYRLNVYPDGSSWTQWADLTRTTAEMERFAPGASRRLADWNTFWGIASQLYAPYWLADPPTEQMLHDRSAQLGHPELYETLRTGNMAALVREHFDDERVQGAFIGAPSDPRLPGSLLEGALGSVTFDPAWVGLPHGGMGALTAAMADAATDGGAEIRVDTPVRRIVVDDGHAIGVELGDGTMIRADMVVSNLGPKATYLRLLEPGVLDEEFTRLVDDLSTTIGWFKAFFALSGRLNVAPYTDDPRAAAYIRMCPSIDTMVDAWEDAESGRPASEQVIQMGSLTVYDSDSAPPGASAVTVLARYVPTDPQGGWDELRDTVTDQIIDQIDGYLPGFRREIVDYVAFSPDDLEGRYGMVDGNIDHIDHLPGQYITGRPFTGDGGWSTPVQGLFCCGAGTHPGGEVSGAPGYNAARHILESEGKRK